MSKGHVCLQTAKKQAGHRIKIKEKPMVSIPKKTPYEHFPLDSEGSMFPGFEDLHALWKLKKADRFLPAWKDFDLQDLQPWWGKMCVIDFTYDPFDFKFRLWGTQITDLYQIDYSQKWYSDLYEQGVYPEDDKPYFEKIARENLIGKNNDTLDWYGRGHVTAYFLDLPLSDDGKTVTGCMAAMVVQT